MNLRLVAVPASMIPIIIIIIQFDVRPEDVFAVGVVPFVAATLVMAGKLGLQGAKFSYITRHYLGPIDSVWRMSGVRIGSEFIKFTTPMFIGAEFVVIYWLHKKGVSPSKAMWIAILDIVTEVFAGGLLSILAGVIALASGAYVVAAVILTTSIFVTTLWMVLFFMSARHTFTIPRVVAYLVKKVGKERGREYITKTNMWMEEVCNMSRKNLRTAESRKVFANAFGFSMASWLLYGISFMIIVSGLGIEVGAFDSVMAVMGANAIGNLPVTVGGSGLAEIGIIAYLNDLDPFSLEMDEQTLEWNAVIAWRIATYYVPIAITWFLLVKLALSKYTKEVGSSGLSK